MVKMHQAKTELSKLIKRVQAGEEIIIARGDTPVAKLVPVEPVQGEKRILGLWKDKILYIAPDFDEPLEDFKEYME